MKITLVILRERVANIAKLTGLHLSLHVQRAMPSTWVRIESADGSRSYSRLCSIRECSFWLDGFFTHWERTEPSRNPSSPSEKLYIGLDTICANCNHVFSEHQVDTYFCPVIHKFEPKKT